MGTKREFQDMLNEYLTNRLLKEELIKRDYVLTTVEKDDGWKGGKIPVPFKASGSTSVKFGGLTAQGNVSKDKYIRGSINDYVEVWGTMKFDHRDLMMDHQGKIPEDTFLDLLPDVTEDFMQYMKEVVSHQLTGGPHFAKVVDATNAATGILVVDRVDRFQLDQMAVLDDNDSATLEVYVIAININSKEVTFSASRGGAAANLAAYSVAQGAVFYHDGVWDGATLTTFTSIKSVLLSAANGGSSQVHGKSKLAYPFLQAVNISGAAISATNILEKLFDAFTEINNRAKGAMITDALMSNKHLGSIKKLIENTKSPFKVTPGSSKANIYGWEEIEITSVANKKIKLVGIQELDDDIIMLMDWRSLTFRSNGMFKKRKGPNGLEYFEVRETDGYVYLLDVCLFGELEFRKPGHCGIIYGINY
jgi:hypothetical protein